MAAGPGPVDNESVMRLLFGGLAAVLFISVGGIGCNRPAPDEPTALPPPPTSAPLPTPTPRQTLTTNPTLAQQPVKLPGDDAPHPETLTEWWYYNGHLEVGDDLRFGFHYVTFVVRVPGFPAARIAHFSITDVEKGVHQIGQRAEVGNVPSAAPGRFEFDHRGWLMAGGGGDDYLEASTSDYSIRLDLSEARPPVLHGGTGSLDVTTAGQNSYYYSRTRLNVTGTVLHDGAASEVTGQAWFDHQWGNFTALDLGWDWMAFQFDDGSDAMLYRIRDFKSLERFDYGTIIGADGTMETITGDDFEMSALGSWTSPSSGIEYPSGWRVRIPSRSVDIEILPVVRSSEFDSRTTTSNIYWEGLVRLSGSHSGVGFVELAGYGTPAR